MRTEEFARRVQASFDAAFGPGTSVVEVLGPSPDDVTATAFEVLVRPPFGARFAVPNAQLKSVPEGDGSAGSIAALSCQLGRDMLELVQQFMNALMLADPTVFLPDKLEPTFDEEAEDESDVEELKALLAQALEERDIAREELTRLFTAEQAMAEKEVSE